jgi:hypothetical protein
MSIINVPGRKYSSLEKFEGTPWNSLVAMHYLNSKYNNHCVIIPYTKKPSDHTDISLRWVQTKDTNGYLNIPKNFWSEFKKHLSHSHDKRFIVFPFGFSCSKSGGHANFMIYDLHTKTLERFDSLGKTNSKCLNNKGLDASIEKIFKKEMGDDFVRKYIKPFTKYKIFQELQDNENKRKLKTDPEYGFCSAWGCFWVDIRLSNPDINRDELIKLTLDYLLKEEKSLTDFIRNYSQNIVEHSKNVQRTLKIAVSEYKTPYISKKTTRRRKSTSRRRKSISRRRKSISRRRKN